MFRSGARENRIAARRGFPSADAMRRADRNPKTRDAYFTLPELARESRSASERAIRRSRDGGAMLEVTTPESGTTIEDVRFWFPEAVGPTEPSGTRVTPEDRYLRVRTFINTEGERVFVPARGSAEARRAQHANAVQWRYIHGDATEVDLADIRGMRIGGIEAASDAKTLLELARRGEFDPAEIYRELF